MSRKSIFKPLEEPELSTAGWPTLRFVLQRHHTTHLHWDLRIEANGVLYSWCMYQQPSINPLRVVSTSLTESLDSCDMLSEGVISDGQDGAGPIVVEEFGWVKPILASCDSQGRSFHEQFLDGRIELWFEGNRLKGGFVLEGRGDRWRMRKIVDEFASIVEPEWTGKSALTGRAIGAWI